MNSAYEAWNVALVDRFYGAAQAGRAAYLAVDDDELATLAPPVGVAASEAAASLATSVVREAEARRCLVRPFPRGAHALA